PMPSHKSAEKRDRQKKRRNAANKLNVGAMRTALKKARAAVDAKAADAKTLVAQAVSIVDRAVTKGVIKKNAASRYISRLTRRGNSATA
ncbi:MAG TPA: 30S ribosomal protein S20, partial [Kofleriaceae bacterium]|nr:30S ribosomal protein S20 [Kofleriaceae bacterium]